MEDQIAVVVATLLDDQKSEALDSIKTIITTALTEMRTWKEAEEARRLINDGDESPEEPSAPPAPMTRTSQLSKLTKTSHSVMKPCGQPSLKMESFNSCSDSWEQNVSARNVAPSLPH